MKNEKDQEDVRCFYYYTRHFQFNPLDFCHENDELYFITGRPIAQAELTERWKSKYFPKATLIMLNKDTKNAYAQDIPVHEWVKLQAIKKAESINECKLDVYFEDTPNAVLELRKLCSNTKIIQYGGRILG